MTCLNSHAGPVSRMRPVRALQAPSNPARWLVLLTFWLAALMPAWAMASAALSGELAPWTQLCRASVIAPRASGQDAEALALREAASEMAQDMGLFQHCPFCHLQAQSLTLPPAPGLAPLRQDLRHGLPERFYSAAHTPHAWRHAPARAPPSFA